MSHCLSRPRTSGLHTPGGFVLFSIPRGGIDTYDLPWSKDKHLYLGKNKHRPNLNPKQKICRPIDFRCLCRCLCTRLRTSPADWKSRNEMQPQWPFLIQSVCAPSYVWTLGLEDTDVQLTKVMVAWSHGRCNSCKHLGLKDQGEAI